MAQWNGNTVSNLCTFYSPSLCLFLHAVLLPCIFLHSLHGALLFFPPHTSFLFLGFTTPSMHVLLSDTLHNQDHSGTLGPEEFKACLISLGYDIGNDAQVLNASGKHLQILKNEEITIFSSSFFFWFCFCFNPSPVNALIFCCTYFHVLLSGFSPQLHCAISFYAFSNLWVKLSICLIP